MRRDKKGISIMIGYVLLVTAAIVMGVIAYQWIKTYVPTEALTCPEDVSIFIEDYWCDDINHAQLNLTLKNNGKFSIAGVFVHVANLVDADIGSINVGSSISRGGVSAGNAIVFLSDSDNSMLPGDEKTISLDMFRIGPGKVYLVDITPARYQEVEGKLRFVNCGDAKVKERIGDAENLDSCKFPLGCDDPDGNDYFTKETCTSSLGSAGTDFCTSNILTEYTCDENLECVSHTVNCDNYNMECLGDNGICSNPQ